MKALPLLRRSSLRLRTVSLTAAVAAVLAGNHSASAQTGAFTFSGNLGLGDSDALVGLTATKTYVGAYNFGSGAGAVTVNGVTFTGAPGINPQVPGVFSTTGMQLQHAGAGAIPAGQLGNVVRDFVYGTQTQGLTLNNLTVGQTYVVSFYSKAWDTGTRVQTLSASGASVGTVSSYDQNTAPVVGSLNVLRYTFQAASASQTITFNAAVAANTNHQYGFSLEQTFNNTWTGGTNWTTSTWSGGAATAPNSAGSNANFPAQLAPTTIDLDDHRTVGHIQFDGTNAWTIGSTTARTLTLQSDVGGAATLSALSGAHAISPHITLSSPTLLKVGAGSITLAGNIASTVLDKKSHVQVAGGTLVLAGTNDYRGETVIGGGTLEVKTVSDYGVNSAIGGRLAADENTSVTGIGLHFQGGTLKFTGTTPQSTNRQIRILNGNGATIDASGTAGATLSFTRTGANTNLFDTGGTRTLTLTGLNTGDNSFSIPLTNEGANATSLLKSGPGTWILNGPDSNSATGATTVNNGVLKLAKASSATVAAVSGPLNIGNGTAGAVVQLGGTGGNQIADASVVTLAGSGAMGSILRTNGLGETVGGLSSAAGAGLVENESNTGTGSTLTLSVAGSQNFGGTLRDGDGVGTDGSLGLIKVGVGTQTLSGNNTYTGTTAVNGGVLSVTHDHALGSTAGNTSVINGGELRLSGNINLAAEPISIASGGINNAGAIRNFSGTNTYAGTLTLTAQSRIVADSGSLTFTNSASVNGVQNLIFSGAGDFVIHGAIDTGTGFISKDNLVGGGAGTLTLGGANTYTGTTTVSAGTLAITGSPTGLSNHVVTGATLRLDYSANDTGKIADTASLTLNGGTVDLAGGSHTETVGSTILGAGTTSILNRTSGSALLQLNAVAVNAGAFLNVTADNIATTDNGNIGGLLPGFRRGNAWAVNAGGGEDGLIVAFTAYNDVNRLGGVIPNDSLANVRIIEAGAAGNVTLPAPQTTINTLQVDAAGGLTAIAPAASTDQLSIGGETAGAIWHQATAGGLTIGAAPNDGVLTTGNVPNATPATLTISNDSTVHPVTIHSAIINNDSDTVNVAKNGAGTVALTGNNTFQGQLSTVGGTLILSGDNAARPTGVTGLVTVFANGILQLQAHAGNTTAGVSTVLSGEQTANQPLIVNHLGTLQLRSDTAVTFAGGNNFGGLGNASIVIDVNRLTSSTNQTLTLAPGGFNIANTTITVTGGNGYALALGKINAVAANTPMTLNPTTASLHVNGYSASATFSSTLNLSGTAAGNTITGAVTNPATSGATTLVKLGSSTWTLSGADTYSGAVTVSGGTLSLLGNKTGNVGAITVSNLPGTDATLNIANGTFALGGASLFVGSATTTPATGTVNQSGGAVTFTGGAQMLLGNNLGIANVANYNLSGGSITTAAASNRGIILGVNGSSIANFTLSGTGALNMTAASGANGDAALQIGRFDDAASGNTTNVFTQTGGTANVGILSMGGNGTAAPGVKSTLQLSGGTFSANQFPRLAAGNSNTATIHIGGTAVVTLPAFPTVRGTTATATIHFDGGTLRPLAASATYMGGLTNAFIKAGGARFEVPSGRDITITQALLADTVSTGGGLTKDGAGVLTLTATSTYTGPTVVSAGTLLINGTISGSAATVNSGGILGGTGTAGPVTIAAGGCISPGVAVGTFTTGSFSLDSAAFLKFDLNTPGIVGSGANDLVTVNGSLTLDGTLQVTELLNFDTGTYRLFNYSGVLTDNGIALEPAFLAANPGSFVDVSIANEVNLVVVPEPGTVLSLLGGLGLILGVRRRRAMA